MGGSEPRVADPTENWDDDFDFHPVSESHASAPSTPVRDASMSPLQDKKNTVKSDIRHWAEPGPSTPKRANVNAENWDDDFQDNTNSPRPSRLSPKARRRRPVVAETENWDDDFEDKQASPSSKSARWYSSDEEEGEFGIAEREEDRTVTSRSRRGALPSVLSNEPPPVPPLPSSFIDTRLDPQPFPRSPTASVFSVPISGHESIAGHSYSSTAHPALRPTRASSSFGALPPSPPIHHARERRRLRKKSRPPRVDANIYELEDRTEARPVTPERSRSPPSQHSTHDPIPDATPSSTGKSSLVSRIGSVGRKWGATRKKRASTGPSEVVLSEQREPETATSRPMSMATPASPASKWFFRAGGGLGAGSGSPPSNVSALPLKHEKSMDRLLAMVGLEHQETPSKRKQKIRQALPKDLTNMASKCEFLAFEPPPSTTTQSSHSSSSRPRVSRHASYSGRRTPNSRSSSVPHSASVSVDDVSSRRLSRGKSSSRDEDMLTPRKSRSSLDPEPGSRGFMGGMRRISMTKKHKRSKTTEHGKNKLPEEPSRSSTSTAATAMPRFSEHTASDRGLDLTPRPPSRIMPRLSVDKQLLPPIELRPPSPSHEININTSEPAVREGRLEEMPESTLPSLPSSQVGTVKAPMHGLPSTPSTLSNQPASPQSASLSRATQPPKDKTDEAPVPRRSSLGDLKIPARISQAQVGLRRDLDMVRDFASSVEQLRYLHMTYCSLVADFLAMLVQTAPPEDAQPRATSPTLFGLPFPGYRARSNTNPQTSNSKHVAGHRQLIAAYDGLQNKYRMAWECAELLIELGGGAPVQPSSPDSSALHTEQSSTLIPDGRKSRERAITLAGDEAKPPVLLATASSPTNLAQWRASTGRHDLSQRQLLLLRDMLNSPESSTITALDSHLEDANRDWRWGDAMSSTVTLPSEHSSQQGSTAYDPASGQKRKSSRIGMRALRDMLRSLKKGRAHNHHEARSSPVPQIPTSLSSISMSTMSSLNLPKAPDPSVTQRMRAKTSTGPESVSSTREHPNSPYVTSASLTHRSSPRRPSLASLFRLGQRSKSSTAKSSSSSGPGRASRDDLHAGSGSSFPPSAEDEDWDQVESASELEAVSSSGSATIRRKHRSMYVSSQEVVQASRQDLNASRASLLSIDSPSTSSRIRDPEGLRRSIKLSKVKELSEFEDESTRLLKLRNSKSKRQSYAGPSVKRPTSRNGETARGTGSLRSPPPTWQGPLEHSPDPKPIMLPDGGGISLAMTPENIRPLLENARDVYARCSECVAEMKSLLTARPHAG